MNRAHHCYAHHHNYKHQLVMLAQHTLGEALNVMDNHTLQHFKEHSAHYYNERSTVIFSSTSTKEHKINAVLYVMEHMHSK